MQDDKMFFKLKETSGVTVVVLLSTMHQSDTKFIQYHVIYQEHHLLQKSVNAAR